MDIVARAMCEKGRVNALEQPLLIEGVFVVGAFNGALTGAIGAGSVGASTEGAGSTVGAGTSISHEPVVNVALSAPSKTKMISKGPFPPFS